jgi:hypothetical protein
VGGFETMEKFLDHIATHPEHLFITSWNSFSWNYLSEVLHVEKHFTCQIHLSRFEKEEIRSVLMSPYDTGEIIFEAGDKNTIERFLVFKEYPFHIKNIDKTINIPFFKLDLSLLHSMIEERLQHKGKEEKEKKKTPEDLAFVRIRDISSGNMLLAQRIWNKSLHNSTIKVDEIYSASFEA